jgi:hypothetical protein
MSDEFGAIKSDDSSVNLRLVAARLEILKAKKDWWQIARIYDDIGDRQLRDKYIALARKQATSPIEQIMLDELAGSIQNVRTDVLESALSEAESDWTVQARLLALTGRVREAALLYLDGIREDILEGNWFAAAFYIRHGLESDITEAFFEMALKESNERGDIWWQIRAFEELGWDGSRDETLIQNKDVILQGNDLLLKQKLARAIGDDDLLLETVKEVETMGIMAFISIEENDESEVEAVPDGK